MPPIQSKGQAVRYFSQRLDGACLLYICVHFSSSIAESERASKVRDRVCAREKRKYCQWYYSSEERRWMSIQAFIYAWKGRAALVFHTYWSWRSVATLGCLYHRWEPDSVNVRYGYILSGGVLLLGWINIAEMVYVQSTEASGTSAASNFYLVVAFLRCWYCYLHYTFVDLIIDQMFRLDIDAP